MALDLLLECRVRPVGDALSVAGGHVHELLREIELELEVGRRHMLEDQRDVAANGVVVGGVRGRPVPLTEEIRDRAAGAGEGHLEAHPHGDGALLS